MAEAISVGAPAPRGRKVELDRPWAWLAAGWRDLTRAPAVSLTYGVLFAAIGWAVTFGLWWADMIYLILPLTTGFLIMGPILAVGLYEVSRRHERGEQASVGDAIGAFPRQPDADRVHGRDAPPPVLLLDPRRGHDLLSVLWRRAA